MRSANRLELLVTANGFLHLAKNIIKFIQNAILIRRGWVFIKILLNSKLMTKKKRLSPGFRKKNNVASIIEPADQKFESHHCMLK